MTMRRIAQAQAKRYGIKPMGKRFLASKLKEIWMRLNQMADEEGDTTGDEAGTVEYAVLRECLRTLRSLSYSCLLAGGDSYPTLIMPRGNRGAAWASSQAASSHPRQRIRGGGGGEQFRRRYET